MVDQVKGIDTYLYEVPYISCFRPYRGETAMRGLARPSENTSFHQPGSDLQSFRLFGSINEREESTMTASNVLRVGIALIGASMVFAVKAQESVQALADQWAEAYNQHDRAGLGGAYTESARLMMHGTATIVGRDDIEQFWAADFEDRNPLTLLTVTHAVEGMDMMLVHGDYRVINREDGDHLGAGRFAHIWTQAQGGEWRLDRDLWSEYFEPYNSSDRVESDIQTLADRWALAYNRHDRGELGSLYTDDARLMMHGTPTIAGRADIESFWAEDFREGNPLTLLTVTHALEGVDMILVHGNYQVIDRDDGGRLGSGRFAHVWVGDRRLGGGWRLDRDLWYERSEPQ
jgi:ketosteroid isomerase-like protein